VRVDLSDHDAYDVGDEPLLLARHAPTWVAKNRRDGIVAAHAAGADVVICDDGLQNPTVAYACQLMVFDPLIGVGNGLLIPAGPLREPLDDLIARIDAVVCIGKAMTHPAEPHTFVVNTLNDLAELSPTQPVVAFAGIGYPEKFFHSLAIQGVHIMSKISFPDHHPFTEEDLATLRTIQDQYRALLVTTEKDYVRLPKAQRFDILPIPLRLEWQESPLQFILEKIHDPRWLA
jgi:tetraacyldisaccharide 4'-kinase